MYGAMICLICTESAARRRQIPIEAGRTKQSRLTAYAPFCDWIWAFRRQVLLLVCISERTAQKACEHGDGVSWRLVLTVSTVNTCSRSQRLPERASACLPPHTDEATPHQGTSMPTEAVQLSQLLLGKDKSWIHSILDLREQEKHAA